MTDVRDPATRATRLAANAAAFAVVAWAVLYLVTTQISSIRAASPFADDPWDAVVSYAAIFLPLVVGATWIRSLRHRGPRLEAATARRIRTGVTFAQLIIVVNVASDAVALMVVPLPEPADGRLALMIGLVVVVSLVTLTATTLLVRAMRLAHSAPRDASEPDLLDDLLGLAGEVPGVARVTAPLDRFLANSAASPRRHRLVFGLLAAVLAGLAFDVWRAIVEGPFGSPFALALIASLAGGGVFVMYLITLVPLRLIRRAD
jgi:hypothetical protein